MQKTKMDAEFKLELIQGYTQEWVSEIKEKAKNLPFLHPEVLNLFIDMKGIQEIIDAEHLEDLDLSEEELKNYRI